MKKTLFDNKDYVKSLLEPFTNKRLRVHNTTIHLQSSLEYGVFLEVNEWGVSLYAQYDFYVIKLLNELTMEGLRKGKAGNFITDEEMAIQKAIMKELGDNLKIQFGLIYFGSIKNIEVKDHMITLNDFTLIVMKN